MYRIRMPVSSLPAALFIALAGGLCLADGEVTILATGASGSYGSEVDTDTRWMTLRYAVGDRVQFRADLSMIQVDALEPGVAYTGLGPISRGRDGAQSGPGSPADPAPAPTAVAPASTSTSRSGVGDLRLTVARRLLGGGARRFRLDTSVEVKAPLADDDDGLGTGEWDYRIGVAGEYRFWSASAFAGGGWNRLGDTPTLQLDDVLDAYVGVDSEPFAGGRLVAGGWLEGWQAAVDETGARAAVGAGIRTTGQIRWRLQLRAGLTDGAEDLAVTAGISFGASPSGPDARGYRR